jgi:hypothetical protein
MIRARYPGKCAACGESFDEGDLIGQVDGDWCCENCCAEYAGQARFFDNDGGDD